MRAVADGRLNLESSSFQSHIDRCLGCRACESVCPAGVEYGDLLESSRFELYSSKVGRGFEYRLLKAVLRHVWLHPRRLKLLFSLTRIFRDSRLPWLLRRSGLTKLLPQRFAFALALLESSGGAEQRSTFPSLKANPSALNAMLFKGCVGEGLFGRVNAATKRVLLVNGYQVESPTEQVCCGALHAHAGDIDGARSLARRNIAAFAGDGGTPVVTNAGGCGAMLISYGHLFADDPDLRNQADDFSKRVRDVGQLLPVTPLEKIEDGSGTVTYDASCHLLYAQKAADDSLRMLRSAGNLDFVPLVGSERCCGGAGIYNMLEPDLSGDVLREKIENVRSTGAETLATGNPGCQMQIGAGLKLAGLTLRVCHPVELVDEWYEQSGWYKIAADERG